MRVGQGAASFLVVATIWACGGARTPRPDNAGGPAIAAEPIARLSLEAGDDRPAATDAEGLRVAMRVAGSPQIGGALERITHLTWRQRTFGPDVIAEAVAAQSCLVGASSCNGFTAKKVFTGRHGVPFADFWSMLMAGYRAAFKDRFGVDAQDVHASKADGRLTLGMRGLLADPESARTYSVTWKAGTFVGHGVAVDKPRPPYAKDPLLGKTLETVVQIKWHYYVFPTLRNAQVNLLRTSQDHGGKGIFFKAARRIKAERASYATESGVVLEGGWPISHTVPTMTVGLGSNNRFGLRKRTHLVRVTFADDDALAGSTPLVVDLTVLDDGRTYPFDLATVHARALEKAQSASRGAQSKFANESHARQQRFEVEARRFASTFKEPKARARTWVDEYTKPHSSFDWNATARTLRITIRTERRVTHKYVHYYPNPAAQNFHCRNNRPCAIPPAELPRGFSRSYAIHSSVVVILDHTGAITNVAVPGPTLTPVQ